MLLEHSSVKNTETNTLSHHLKTENCFQISEEKKSIISMFRNQKIDVIIIICIISTQVELIVDCLVIHRARILNSVKHYIYLKTSQFRY